MPRSFSQVLLHIVYGTKRRHPWITGEMAERLHPYIGGVIRAKGGALLEIGGAADHVHMLVRWKLDESISELMRIVKGRSSRWIHESFPQCAAFEWQEGYAAFSVSKSQEDVVRTYIARQEEHHARRDFKAEVRELLIAHDVEFDDRYVFE